MLILFNKDFQMMTHICSYNSAHSLTSFTITNQMLVYGVIRRITVSALHDHTKCAQSLATCHYVYNDQRILYI